MTAASGGKLRSRHRASRGAALLFALVALVVVGALASALGAVVLGAIRSARIASRDDALLNTAESGIDLAISRLAADPEWRGAEAVPVPGGTCSVSVARADDGGFEITTRAAPPARKGRKRSSRTCTVRVRVEGSRAGTPSFVVTEWDASFEQ
jgi:type II secretory pathway pseudopilin PulG